ncbi:phosphotransferase family protein [Phenylobacterium montanum]|uniref:Phosphotransferase n=1 Tax=Phenylobacterium montanum TaxID=2823693 RepID=A0A975G2I5_9CAUL|nr:phosphotransferase [Caulobacter sp. S6]QUD89695.1 phosphotransferase [Caulobacter sp. S6]
MTPDADLDAFARDAGLIRAGETPQWAALTGGVSSDIWRLDSGGRSYCLKRALARLKVKDDWTAPVERNLYEWRWFETVGGLFPSYAPRLVARDEARGVFAMDFLDPARHSLWKAELLAGRADVAFASEVGRALGRIHAATAGDAVLAANFQTDAFFFDLRLDAYLLAAGRRRPEVAERLAFLVERTAATRLALVHGDVSPKNIMIGPAGPVFLDAETAWWGDPAFDLAFCLNHLLLKQRVAPGATADLDASFDALASAYLAHVDWEPRAALEARAATLLPGLLLARVDGKSPVEYLPGEAERAPVRAVALGLLQKPVETLDGVRAAWARIAA